MLVGGKVLESKGILKHWTETNRDECDRASLSGLFSENDVDTSDESSQELLLEFGHAGDHEALVPIAAEMIDAKSLPLKKLIALRNQEAKSSGYAIRDLRHRFADGIERQVNALSGLERSLNATKLRDSFIKKCEMAIQHSARRSNSKQIKSSA